MKKNDLFQLEITDMGVDGEGIGHYDGMTFFVKDALIGDVICARATKLKKNYGYARVEEVITPSTFRIEPKCPHHKRCGGCQIQALSYEKQLEFKQEKVRGNLIRIGGFSPEEIDAKMLPIVGMEDPFRYRNKAQFPVGTDKEGNIITGFYAARTHSIISVDDCVLGVSENTPILTAVKDWMKANTIKAYDEITGKGLVRHVLIRFGFTTKEIMVCLIINGKKLPAQADLIERLTKIKGMTSISININTQNTNVILGDTTKCIWGQPYITDYIHLRTTEDAFLKKGCEVSGKAENVMDVKGDEDFEISGETEHIIGVKADGVFKESAKVNYKCDETILPNSVQEKNAVKCKQRETENQHLPEFLLTDTAVAYHISPQSFYQVNPVQTEKLYSTTLEYAGLTGREYVWDLYCGIGTISLFLAQKAKQVYGVEIVPQAIEDAKNNAKLNGITNAEFFVGKAEEVLPEFYEKLQREVSSVKEITAFLKGEGIETCSDEVNKDMRYSSTEKDVCVQDETAVNKTAMLTPDVIVVDPPRKGCDQACLDTMLKMKPQRIVYVSCDSATLARDLRILCDGGYDVGKIRAFDQFAHTGHVETVCLLGNRNAKPDTHVKLSVDTEELQRVKNGEKI